MAAIAALLVVASLSVLIVRIAAIALTMTGLSSDIARLQAQSAFTGAGFTTNESERVVSEPVRRRIIRLLMLLGNVGFTSVIATLIISFLSAESTGEGLRNFGVILIGLALLWWVTRLRLFNDWIDRTIQRALENAGVVRAVDYGRLLRVRSGYTVSQIEVKRGDWLEDKPLEDSRPRDEGVVVLGIERTDGTYLGLPSSKTSPQAGDRLTVYGTEEALQEISRREAGGRGDMEHAEATREARSQKAEELIRDRERSPERAEEPGDDPSKAPPASGGAVHSSDADGDRARRKADETGDGGGVDERGGAGR